MAIDAYSLCPGGTGKKIKFCCADFLAELQKIDRMVEGEQYIACLKHVDHLLEQEPGRDRPCLLATKCELLRATDQPAAARKTAAAFMAKYPTNQIALAESAMIVAERDARKGLDLVQRALRAAAGSLSGRTYQAMGMVAGALLRDGFPQSARALLESQADVAGDDDRPLELLAGLSQAGDLPLLLRQEPPLALCPDDAPWKQRFSEALEPIRLADWQTAAQRLAALAAEVPDQPSIWRNLAALRAWSADHPGSIDALRRYAALRAGEQGGLEDAVEAEATAMFLAADPLGDHLKMFKLVWTVKDVDRAQEAFLSAARMRPLPFDPAQFSDGETPPPKAAYMLLDRPMPESAEGLSLESVPRLLGQALLFGKQTDREARFEVMGVAADEVSATMALVRETAGEAISPQAKQEVIGEFSASQKLLRAAWQPPKGTSPEQIRTLVGQHLQHAILDQWPDLKLGVLGGRSPRDVSGDESSRVRLLAAIMVVEYWCERLPGEIDFNELRVRLGLPALEAIDSRKHPVLDLPLVRIERLQMEGLSDEDLIAAYYRAGAFAVRAAMRKFAQAIIGRESLAGRDEQQHAYATLARTEEDIPQALAYIEQGRRAAESKKRSSASWDLMELSLRFAQRNGPEAMRMIEHLQRKHLEEPGVGEALTRMLIDVGLLRPDGTPAIGPGGAEPAMAAAEESASEPSRLWTPDSVEPASGGGGKLWTPE